MRAHMNASLLNGCHHVYLDVGANVGIQLQHLFSPQLNESKKSKLQPVFNEAFGTSAQDRLDSVCAVLFEPNPHHAARLRQLRDTLNHNGGRVELLSRVAASNDDGEKSFHILPASPQYHEWGSSLIHRSGSADAVPVMAVDFSHWLRQTVLNRTFPPRRSSRPSLVMVSLPFVCMLATAVRALAILPCRINLRTPLRRKWTLKVKSGTCSHALSYMAYCASSLECLSSSTARVVTDLSRKLMVPRTDIWIL